MLRKGRDPRGRREIEFVAGGIAFAMFWKGLEIRRRIVVVSGEQLVVLLGDWYWAKLPDLDLVVGIAGEHLRVMGIHCRKTNPMLVAFCGDGMHLYAVLVCRASL